jgi:hypothetical protein
MRRLLCTIGFTGKTAEEFFDLLRRAGVQSVIDVRQNRAGQLSAFAKYPDLEFFLRQIGNIGYRNGTSRCWRRRRSCESPIRKIKTGLLTRKVF